MTITTNLSSVTRDGNGATTSFPFDFWVPSAEELQFWITDASGVLTQTTNCTVTLAGSGGTVVYPAVGGTVLPSGAKITIMRDMAFTQTLDLVNATTFHAEVIEGALDRLTAQIQQVDEAVERAVKAPVSSTTSPDDLLNELASDVASAASSAATATAQAGLAATAKTGAETAQGLAEDARDAAVAAVGGVRVSDNDTTAAPLETKLLPGTNINMSTQNDGGAETRTINCTVPAKLTVAANLVFQSICGGA